jgi:hypothetical protein
MRRLIILALLVLPFAYSVSCDCHPSGVQNRVCLFYEPYPTLTMTEDYFDFAVKIRNFYRTEVGAAITDITGSVVSCTRSGGGACTWSTNGATDFHITITPSVIAQSLGGPYGECPTTVSGCRTCTTGRVETMNSRITVNNAADGTYVIRYRVGWQPLNRERFMDVTITFSSGGGCTSDGQCSGSTPRCNTATGACVACTQASHCDDGNPCTTDSCNSNTCSNTAVTAGTPCSGGYCCGGVCDTTLGNTNYHADCRSGPACSGTSWEYAMANNGNLCGGFACMECSNGLCNSPDSSRCPSGQTCSSGTCISTCTDECTAGSYSCSGTNRLSCGNYDADSCLEFGGSTACPDNICTEPTCSAGVCGETNVLSGMTDEACFGSTGCTGGSCACNGNGQCTSQVTCTDDCTTGSYACDGTNRLSCGNFDADSCLEWGNPTACPDNICTEPTCISGVCGVTNVALGQTDEACFGSTGCTGGSCACNGNGLCTSQVTCTNECQTSGQTDCSGNSVRTCGNYDADSCLEYSLSDCGTQFCSSGVCVECTSGGQCDDNNPCTTDSCTSGSCTHTNAADGSLCGTGHCCAGVCDTTLAGEDLHAACRTGPSCRGTSWEYTASNQGQICSGACTECDQGYCSHDDDSRCTGGQSCNSGTCSSTCVDACTAGTTRCQGTSIQTCSADHDSDSCTEWGGTTACPDPVCSEPTCSSGVCGTTLVPNGLTDEGCYYSTGCTGGSCSCSNGICVSGTAECIDECVSGAKDCFLSSARECGNWDSDSCTEWKSTSCPYGCEAGACKSASGSGGRTSRCTPSWSCTEWSECIDNKNTRTCTDSNNCGITNDKPFESKSCRGSGSSTTDTQARPGRNTTSGTIEKTNQTEGPIETKAQKSNLIYYLMIGAIVILGLLFLIIRKPKKPEIAMPVPPSFIQR